MPLSNYALNTFVSQHLASLGVCSVASVSAEFAGRSSWFTTYTFKRIFHNHVPDDKAALAFALLRRADAAIDEWEQACQTLSSLAAEKSIEGYFKALRHLEACLAAMEQWYQFVRTALKQKHFKQNDGSDLERLNDIYNVSRHYDPANLAPGDLHRLWITNDAVNITGKALLFSEIREMLLQIGKFAVVIAEGQNTATA